jgi:hypothetical protein
MQFHGTSRAEDIQLSVSARFQGRIRSLAIAAGLIAIAGLSLPFTLNAANEQESDGHDNHKGCTLATLQGRYLFAESGECFFRLRSA